ncbi:hypothetical protein [Nocardia wallacei]|uniref:hypothetical protein n=1 Tax=Nocardia wallacei TaxID=480035 RepID=UPI0024552274|nr:hypothetical protein [Nocardia wallacei]
MTRRLSDREVRRILRLHVDHEWTAPRIARAMNLSSKAVYDIIWGRTHQHITGGENRSAASTRAEARARLIRSVYAQTGSKQQAADAAGVSWQTAHYHLTKDDAA